MNTTLADDTGSSAFARGGKTFRFSDLVVTKDDPLFPIFMICGAEWTGFLWEADEWRSLRCDHRMKTEGISSEITERIDGFCLILAHAIGFGEIVKRSEIFACLEDAAMAALTGTLETRMLDGKAWYLVTRDDRCELWKSAFGERDTGEVYKYNDGTWGCHRIIAHGDRALKIIDESGGLVSFEDAAAVCASLCNVLVNVRDRYQEGFHDDRKALRRVIARTK